VGWGWGEGERERGTFRHKSSPAFGSGTLAERALGRSASSQARLRLLNLNGSPSEGCSYFSIIQARGFSSRGKIYASKFKRHATRAARYTESRVTSGVGLEGSRGPVG